MNGIETYANRCPNCREVIFEPRPSRPLISNDDSDDDSKDSVSNSATLHEDQENE
jgi:hypothetical protein